MLLIDQHLPAIINLIQTNEVTLVVSPTGSGKSVGIPYAIGSVARCFVVVPTRTAARSLASYQAERVRKAGKSISIGYAAEGDVHYNETTRIVYVTGGHMRRKMLSYFKDGIPSDINFCEVLFLDEAHIGSLDLTVILSLWMYARKSGVAVPRLLLASATPVPMKIQPEPAIYNVEVKSYPIEFRYLDKDISLANEDLYGKTAELAINVHNKEDVSAGHILVFAPGSGEVQAIANSIISSTKNSNNPSKQAIVISAYGAMEKSEIDAIYQDTTPTQRKIIVATNIAEMSITISDVGIVIDTLVEKRSETSQSGGFRLTTQYISQDSAKQRAGRTGRTRPGIVYRMMTKESFEKLDKHRIPELMRIPIHGIIMELLSVGLRPEAVLIEAERARIDKAITLLLDLKLVESIGDHLKVTEAGKFVPNLPLSVQNADFVWRWLQINKPPVVGVIIATLIDCYGPSYYWTPRREANESNDAYLDRIEAYQVKYFEKFRGLSDLHTAMNMWNDLVTTVLYPSGKVLDAPFSMVTAWSTQNSINNKKVQEILTIMKQCVNALQRMRKADGSKYDILIGKVDPNVAIPVALPLLASIYSSNILIQKRPGIYQSSTRIEYRLDKREAINNFELTPPRAIIALVTAEISSQRGPAISRVSFAVDTTIDGDGNPVSMKPKKKEVNKAELDEALALLEELNLTDNKSSESEKQVPANLDALASILSPWLSNADNAIVQNSLLKDYTPAEITSLFKKHKALFPLRRRYLTISDAQTLISNIISSSTPWVTEPYSVLKRFEVPLQSTFQVIGSDDQTYIQYQYSQEDYNNFDILIDYVNERSRMRCNRKKSKISPWDAWGQYGKYVENAISKVLTDEADLSIKNVRDALYDNYEIEECRSEKILFLVGIFRILGIPNPRIFDVGAGWGSCLAAALAVAASGYVGIEPNPDSQSGFRELIDLFATVTGQQSNAVVLETTMPHAILPPTATEFDITFLSPPGYDYEIYGKEESQSIQEWKTKKEWTFGFLFPTIKRCWELTKYGGFFCLQSAIVAEIAPFIESTLENSFFCGPISVLEGSKYKSIWIWQKVAEDSLTETQQLNSKALKTASLEVMNKLYPELINIYPVTPFDLAPLSYQEELSQLLATSDTQSLYSMLE